MNAAAEQLFEQAVQASRLARVVAPFTMIRLLVRANVPPRALTREGLARALPEIEQGLRVYLSDDDLEGAMRDLRRLAGVA